MQNAADPATAVHRVRFKKTYFAARKGFFLPHFCFLQKGLFDMTKEEIAKRYFTDDEEVLWFDSPKKQSWFTRMDVLLVPLTMVLGGLMLVYAVFSMILMFRGQSMAFALSGITILLIAFYLLFGRIWYRRKRISRNLYFVTSARVFVFNTLRDVAAVDIPLENVSPVCAKHDLYLSSKLFVGDFVYGLGLDLFFRNFVQESPAFYGIDDPAFVSNIIERAQNQRKAVQHDSDFI